LKIALLADVHANLEALDACLEHARASGAARLAFLGDLVGYGADPAAVVDLVAAEVGRGALALKGNHDEAAVADGPPSSMHEAAAAAILWTRKRLSPGQRAFLARLPLVVREGELLLVHASAAEPAQWEYVSGPLAAERCMAAAGNAAYVACGHVHEAVLYYHGAANRLIAFRPVAGVPVPVPAYRRWLAIPGSVGQPRDRSAAASYAILDTDRATITFFRVPYDWRAAAAKVRAAGLPEWLALRLERGE
jgi:diadenosine tetraphosphatase ApaH/serine/threonine PP2A family protein phosphatase